MPIKAIVAGLTPKESAKSAKEIHSEEGCF
jgi:hypothetical protein